MTVARTVSTPTVAPITPRIRSRRLMVDTTSAPAVHPVAPRAAVIAPAVMAELEQLAEAQFEANKRSNAASREADATKRVLYKKMLAAGVREFRASAAFEGGIAQIKVEISQPDSEAISVEKLRALVDDATFMRIVSATKAAVTREAGSNVVVASTVVVPGKEDLRIKEVDG